MVTDRDSLSEATRSEAGFSLRARGATKLEILGPPGLPDDLCQPVIAAVRAHAAEILRLLRWLDDEKRPSRLERGDG